MPCIETKFHFRHVETDKQCGESKPLDFTAANHRARAAAAHAPRIRRDEAFTLTPELST